MLKRLISVLISLLVMFNIVSCKDKVEDKVLLSGNMDNISLIELDKDDLKDKIENEEDFMLVIMLEGCSSCEAFNNDIIKPFIKETYATVYSIYSHQLDALEKFDNKPKYKVAPNFQVYKQGKSIVSENYDTSKDYFKSLDAFKTFVSGYVVFPKVVEVSEEKLDVFIQQGESFILYIGWNKCGDCASVYQNVLKEYLLKSKYNSTILYLEVDEYRRNKPSSCPIIDDYSTPEDMEHYNNYMAWLEFAKKYNFADYEDGKVPTFQFYENAKVKESLVYKNDIVEDGVVLQSFYKELIGKAMDEESLNKYHNDKLIEFLNKYYR